MTSLNAPHRRLVAFSGAVVVLLLGHAPAFVTDPQIGGVAQPWRTERVCAEAAPGRVGCHVLRRVETRFSGSLPFELLRGLRSIASRTVVAQSIAGFSPADIRDAYKLGDTVHGSPVVAVVTAFDNPYAESDLQIYRSTFGLPPCSVANGCFRKVNESGLESPLPTTDASWAIQTALSIEIVSAVCPDCKILLVEATQALTSDLGTAVNAAAFVGATVILSNYAADEDAGSPSDEALYFRHPGVSIVAPGGDTGFGVSFPASSQYVTAVGGTSLSRADNARGWTETVWGAPDGFIGTGSGCSAYFPKPLFQLDAGCNRRTVNDVAAVADPNTGVAVYDSFSGGGWGVYGGTEVAAAIVSGIYGLAGAGGLSSAEFPYMSPGALFDVTSGATSTCGGYLCTAQIGYDGPTGLGTPNGLAAFGLAGSSVTVDPTFGTVPPGHASTTATVSATVAGADETLSLSARGVPFGVTVVFSPTSIVASSFGSGTATSSTMTITTSAALEGTYNIGVVGQGTSTTDVRFFTLTIANPPPPTVTFGVAPSFIVLGHHATLSWTTSGASSCTASGAWTGGRATSGSETVTPDAPHQYGYTLTCTNGLTATTLSTLLTVELQPTVVLTATPTHINPSDKVKLVWTSSNATACAASGDWSGIKDVSGSHTVRPTASGKHHCRLACSNPAAVAKDTATVTVR